MSTVMTDEQLAAYREQLAAYNRRGSGVSSPSPSPSLWSLIYYSVSAGALGAGTYHGYKRNRGSFGWTIGWAAFSAIAPVIAIPVAIAQGFGKPKKKR